MIRQRFSGLSCLLFALACSPKAPAPLQCTSDADCKGLVCNAGGTCVSGATIDKDKSTIDVSQAKAVANGTDVVAITVTLRDASGNALISRGVQLSVDGSGNTLSQPTLSTNAVGQVTGTLTSTRAETKNVTAVAGVVIGQTPGANAVTLTKKGSVEFDADPGRLAPPGSGDSDTKFAVTAADGTSAPNVTADGATAVKIHLVLRDANGNLVPNAPVSFSVNGVDITVTPANGQGTTDSNGEFNGTITSHTVQTAKVNFVVGSISESVTITFHPGPADAGATGIFVGTGTGTPVACGGTSQPACTIKADGSTGPVSINVHAVDAFGNEAVGAKVWFSWPNTCDPNAIDPTVCEQGNTFTFPQSHIDLKEGGTQPDPLIAEAGGTFTDNITFASNHAEVKHLVLHVDDLDIPLPPVTVTAGAPSGTLSLFAVFGDPTGAPIVADSATSGYTLVAYIADGFNNPAPNIVIDFASSGGGSDSVSALPDQARRCSTTPPFVCRSWSDTATYQTGDLAYDDDNNAYASLVNNNSNNKPASTVGAKWSLVQAIGPVVTDETGLVGYGLSTDTVNAAGDLGVRHVSATTPEVAGLWGSSACAPPTPSTPTTYPCTPTLTAAFGPGPVDQVHSTITPSSPASVSTDVDPANVVAVTIHLFDQHGNDAPDQGVSLDAFDAPTGGNECATCLFTAPTNSGAVYGANIASPTAGTVYARARINDSFNLSTAGITFNPGAVSASNSSFSFSPASTSPLTANGTASAIFVVNLKDAQNNAIPSVTVTPNLLSGTAGSSTVVTPTSAQGVGAVTVKSTKADTKTYSVTANAVTISQTASAAFMPGAPSAASNGTSLTVSPATISTDSSSTAKLTLTVADINGNPVGQGFSVIFSDASGHGNFTPSNTILTDANSVAVTNYHSAIAPATETISAKDTATSGAAFTKAAASTIAVQAGVVSLANSTLFTCASGTCGAQGISATTAGSNLAFTATPRDGVGGGNLYASGTVGLTCTGTAAPATASVVLNGSGTNALTSTITSAKTGTFNCTATYDGGSGPVPFKSVPVTFNPGAATDGKTSAASATPPSAVADNSQAITVAIAVHDGNDNPVADGTSVNFVSDKGPTNDTFTCLNGGGAPPCVTVGGVAAAALRSKLARTDGGAPSIHVTPSGLTQRNVGVTFRAGAAAKVDFLPGYQPPASIGAGAVMYLPNTSGPIATRFLDQFNNQTSLPAPVAVTVSVTPSGGGTTPGTLGGNTVVNTSDIGVFYTLSINGASLGSCDSSKQPCRTLTASAPGLQPATSTLIHVVPANGSSCTADGPLGNCTGSVRDIVFNSNAQLNPGVVYNYNTITIAPGVTVSSTGAGVLELRASGDVTINGAIDVSGGNGGSAGGQGNNGGGFGGSSGTASAISMDGARSSGLGGSAWGGAASYIAYGGGPNVGVPGVWGFGYGGNGAGGLLGGGGSIVGGGGGGGSSQIDDRDSGGGAGGGGHAGGAGGFAGADGCVQAGGGGGGPNGAPATGCGASALGGASAASNGCPASGYAGGNGGIGSSPCTPLAGSGGGGSIGCDAAGDLAMSSTLRPGSGGGGGGSGGDNNFEARSGGGGGGGGGGGALRIISNTKIALGSSGAIRANGGRGGNGAISLDDCDDDSGGAGGGGSGGAIYLQAPVLSVPSGSSISAQGGAGGGSASTNGQGVSTPTVGPGGNGGIGRIRLSVDATLSGGVGGSVIPVLPNGNLTPGNAAATKAYVAQYPQ